MSEKSSRNETTLEGSRVHSLCLELQKFLHNYESDRLDSQDHQMKGAESTLPVGSNERKLLQHGLMFYISVSVSVSGFTTAHLNGQVRDLPAGVYQI